MKQLRELGFRCPALNQTAVDHFQPQSVHPKRVLDYLNLVYSCRTCNLIKGAVEIDDPVEAIHRGILRCNPDGHLVAVSKEANRLILVLDLNSPQAVQWRLMWSRITEMARQNDSSLYTMLVGFPQNLPNLQSIPVLTPSPNISVADLDGDLIRITAYRTILPILLAFTLGGIDRNDDFLATGIANVTGFVVHCLIVLCQMFFRSTS